MDKKNAVSAGKEERLGNIIRRIREFNGMSRESLAQGIGGGCTPEMVSLYEEGALPMETDTFFALVKALGVTPNDLAPPSMRESAPCLFGYGKLNESHRKLVDGVVKSFLQSESKQVTG